MKKICLALVVALLVFSSGAAAWAAEAESAQQAAQELYEMGLFLGTNQGFELEAACDRVQGAVIFTRLLGGEEEALNTPKPHPFIDIGNDGHWAAPYIGYLYINGLARGTTYNTYGTGPLEANQFATFCLRALGYREGENSDFLWSNGLNTMVEKKIISGALRNRLKDAPIFTRGDAVLMARATLDAPLKEGEQTLLQKLAASGVVDLEALLDDDLRVVYPTGMFTDERLQGLVAQQGYQIVSTSYEPGSQGEEDIRTFIRETQGRSYDLLIVPAGMAQTLHDEGLTLSLGAYRLPTPGEMIEPLKNNTAWYGHLLDYAIAQPIAFESLCLYYDSNALGKTPNWDVLFQEANRGGIYMPNQAARAVPVALQHTRIYSYTNIIDERITEVTEALANQWPLVTAYLDEGMLTIPERQGAKVGVLASHDIPALAELKEKEAAYANWQVRLPDGGTPLTIYYAVIPQDADKAKAYELLAKLVTPSEQALTAHTAGYLPVSGEAGQLLEGLTKAIFPSGVKWQRCRFMDVNAERTSYFEQTIYNALCLSGEKQNGPTVSKLTLYFEQNGLIKAAYQLDLTERVYSAFTPEIPARTAVLEKRLDIPAELIRPFTQQLNRLGIQFWQAENDGPQTWWLELFYTDGTNQTCRGGRTPLTWEAVGAEVVNLAAIDFFGTAIR